MSTWKQREYPSALTFSFDIKGIVSAEWGFSLTMPCYRFRGTTTRLIYKGIAFKRKRRSWQSWNDRIRLVWSLRPKQTSPDFGCPSRFLSLTNQENVHYAHSISHVGERWFSCLVTIRAKYRNRLNAHWDILLKVSNIGVVRFINQRETKYQLC